MPADVKHGRKLKMVNSYYSIPWHPVTYQSIQFDSKLDCRWYIFFQTLGVPTVYHPPAHFIPELYGTPEYRYTPDLGLLGMPYPIVEIKPNMRQTGGVIKMAILKLKAISRGGTPTALIAGPCWPGQFDIAFFKDGQNYRPPIGFVDKVRLTFGISRKEAKSVLVLKMLLGNYRGDYLGAFRRSYERVK